MNLRHRALGICSAACSVLLVFGAIGCGGEADSASPPSVAIDAPADAAFAEIATDGSAAMWLAVAGYNREKDFGARVFRSTGGRWKDVGSPGPGVSDEVPISIALAPGGAEPCLGYTNALSQHPVVSCLAGSGWRSAPLPPELRWARLLQLKNHGNDLLSLFLVSEEERSAMLRLYRLDAPAWTPVGPRVPVPPGSIAQLASVSGPPNGITLGLEVQGRNPARYLLSLEGGRWKRQGAPLRDPGIGPLVGGPAITDTTVLFPVNDAERTPWTFAATPVPEASSGKPVPSLPLSTGRGNAQGRVDALSGGVWASWQQDTPLPDGNFRASIHAARLDERGAPMRKVTLWRGISVGPGSTQVIEFRGEPLALFMPARSDRNPFLTVETKRVR